MACPKHAPQTGENSPRRWNAAGFLSFRLEVLTPVFVGTGEELSPLDYVIRKEGREHVLYLADCAGWLQAHAADPAIGAALAEGDMLRLRRLLTEQLDEKLYGLARLPFTLPATAQELQKRITEPRSTSKAEILPLPRSAVSGCAFLPGSSLKGALLTPLIDHLDNRRTAGRGDLRSATAAFRSGYTEALKKMFGDIGNHAMQALKVADIPLAPQATGIVAAREVRRAADPNKPGTPKPPCEALLPLADGSLLPYGSLHLDCRSGQPAVELPGGEVLPWQRIGELCNAFYGMRFQQEWDRFYALPHLERVRQALQPVRARVERLDPAREWLVRVGRYSHLECMTVSRNAPKHKKGYGKTRTLADNTLPFGWVILHFCQTEEYEAGTRAVREAAATAQHTREQRRCAQEETLRDALQQQRLRQEAAARMRAAAEEERLRREQEAAAREARLAGLSPQERAIAALSLPDADDQTARTLFQQLDSLEAPLQRQAAEALKAFWQASGKWQGKQLSKKQKEKVARIRSLLGE